MSLDYFKARERERRAKPGKKTPDSEDKQNETEPARGRGRGVGLVLQNASKKNSKKGEGVETLEPREEENLATRVVFSFNREMNMETSLEMIDGRMRGKVIGKENSGATSSEFRLREEDKRVGG